ncbi:4-galactosyl-N-acetylglucosaminide 3-alpha-L-fucosyltransferase FUT6-like [Ambystoma mexicanum]|uniref:4-galactosyl-N-acetylglucosaminide 3-alpha-L-fucosyltransferase FUT6-like n=1 Tax=Ambystoma mexicanum TaxID=8296 RepID=UPI0037E714CE
MDSKTQAASFWKAIVLYVLVSFLTSFCIFSFIHQSSKGRTLMTCLKVEMTSTHSAGDGDHKKTTHYSDRGTSREVVILLWTWPFGERFPLDRCAADYGIFGCNFTTDRNWYNRADAVIIHHCEFRYTNKGLPREPRPHNQRWIWLNLESPKHSPNLRLMDNRINLTMSYRADADIFLPYGWLEKAITPQNFSIPTKTKLVAWVVSHWDSTLERVAYYNQLKKHINIDMFGRGNKNLARNMLQPTISQYKFYLAFENSISQDYITEKFWNNALMSGTVPVVLGPTRENYERFAPADTFIHVNDFPSAKELAAYLKFLDTHEEQYQRYFNWRKELQPIDLPSWSHRYCKACQKLQQDISYKTIPSIANWFK